MSYIGNTSTTQAFTPAVDFFNGNGSTTAFTLSRPVASVAQVQVVISNVPQKPGDAFTVSGNTITFTSAPPSGTQNIYVYYTSPITQVIAPGQGTVGSDQLQSSINITTLSTTNGATVQGLTVGKGAGAVSTNTAVGASALAANTTGDRNFAAGGSALAANTTGAQNAAAGYLALATQTTGNYNAAFGAYALNSNTTAANNSAFGYTSLYSNTTGANNTGVGFGALFSNTTGSSSTALGYQAGYANTTGQIVAIGESALLDNTTGTALVAVGVDTLGDNTTGSYNTALGKQALRLNTTASNNTAVGYQAGYSNTVGARNTFLGDGAGRSTTGDNNCFVGRAAGYNATSGSNNTFVGAYNGSTGGAGQEMTTGSKNTILGSYNGNQGGLDIRTSSNNIVLSDGDGNPRIYWNSSGIGVHKGNTFYVAPSSGSANLRVEAANGAGLNPYIYLTCPGSNEGALYYERATSRLYVYSQSGGVYLNSTATSWTGVSDERLKDIIEPIENAAQRLKGWRTVFGKFKTDEEGTRRAFFIAQDLLANTPEVVDTLEPEKLGVHYTETIPVVAAAVNEHTDEIASLKAIITQLQADVAALKGQA